jgi:hypothetical protein
MRFAGGEKEPSVFCVLRGETKENEKTLHILKNKGWRF